MLTSIPSCPLKKYMEDIETLKTENEKLKKINAVKSDLISISAHQLRTSLSALKWILRMFIDKDLGKITGEQEEFIKKALDSNDRMIALVNDLLTLNHAEDTSIKFKMEKADILELLEQTIFEFEGETHKKGIELIFLKPHDEIPLFDCDREMMRVVFQNMIENAIKYSKPDDKVLVSLKYDADKKKIGISVHDTGIGIKPEDQPEIFNKFFRAPNAVAKDYIGSGLGLFTTKNIVERHNGTISFESSLGEGTTFFVALPIL
jgi:signal transduction histidine kinase